jgi:FkbM family methyltransferase
MVERNGRAVVGQPLRGNAEGNRAKIAAVRPRDVEGWLRTRLRTNAAVRALRAWFSASARREARDDHQLRLLLESLLDEDSNCVDVGGHRGGVLEQIVRLAPRGRHIVYEPLPEFCENLRRRFPEVTVREAALSDRSGERTFIYVRNQPGLSGFRRRAYPTTPTVEEITVRTERLDDSLPEGYDPTVIKIDVEGAEREVLEGAIETIALHKPTVVFEHGKGAAPYYSTAPRDVYTLLCERAGLQIFDLDGNGPFDLAEFERIFDRGDRWNFVAHPPVTTGQGI